MTQAEEKAQKILEMGLSNIEKRPVLSLPDALSTLKNKVGGLATNYAALFAALSRAAGIPCRVEAGLAYMKVYAHHALNSVYLENGSWQFGV